MNRKLIIITVLSVAAGLFFAWTDSRPNWDDTGILIGLILLFSMLFGWLAGKKPWLIGLATGIWIPLHGIFISNNFGSLIAMVPAFAGAFGGYFFRKIAGEK